MNSKKSYIAFFLLGLFTILLNVQSFRSLYAHPILGFQFTYDGIIYDVDSDLLSDTDIQPDYKILSVDEMSFLDLRSNPVSIYRDSDYEYKESINLLIENQSGEQYTETVHLTSPDTLWLLKTTLPIITGFAFSLIGLFVYFYSANRVSKQFFIVCQLMSIVCTVYPHLTLSSDFASLAPLLSLFCLIWVGYNIYAFHVKLFVSEKLHPKIIHLSRYAYLSPLFLTSSTVVIMGALIYEQITRPTPSEQVTLWLGRLNETIRFHFLAWLVIVLILLFYLYRVSKTKELKKQLGIVFVGMSVSLLPYICFTIIPYFVIGRAIIVTDITCFFFIIIPFLYAFLIRSYNLMGLEPQITRYTTQFILCNVLGITYLLLKILLQDRDGIGIDLFLIILVLLLFYPLRERLQKFLERLLYGGGYTTPEMIGYVFRKMTDSTEYTSQKLTNMINQIATDVIQATSTQILLPQTQQVNLGMNGMGSSPEFLPQNSKLYDYFRNLSTIEPKENYSILQNIPSAEINEYERSLLDPDQYKLVVPLHAEQQILGFILLGHKKGGGIYDTSDLIALNTITHLSSLILHIIETNQQILQLNQELLRRDGNVRREISSDLHNRVLSRLAVLIGEIDMLKLSKKEDLSADINSIKENIIVIDDISRALIDKNYPPELLLGLRSSIKHLKRQFQIKHPEVRIQFQSKGSDKKLSEEMTLNLFRIIEGALHNIVEHANATLATIQLEITEDQLQIYITDNGDGFDVQSQTTIDGHFGLRIIRTMATSIGGKASIQSEKEVGTKVSVTVPLNMEVDIS